MFTSADVSVIVPSYNSRRMIAACLQSLRAQTRTPLEIIVVDSSTDDTLQIVREQYPEVKTVQVNWRLFPGPARNLGVTVARGMIVAFTDSDCVVAPDWVERMVACHAAGHSIVGGAIEVGNAASEIAWAGHLGEFREFLPLGKPRPIWHVPTCNISYRKSLFLTSGGFPDAYYPQEDMLFNYLLRHRGWQIWFDPAIRIRHFCRDDWRGHLSHQHRIGRVTYCVLRRLDLEGAAIVRHGWLASLATPAFGGVKFVRTASKLPILPTAWRLRLKVLFWLALGTIWWTRGFAAGLTTGLSGIRGWTDPEETIFGLLRLPPEPKAPPG